jgi:hypothetical protein
MTRRRELTAITLLLLLAAGLRFCALGDVPPGLAHDEVANWLIARDVLAGRHAVYFTTAYGHEPLYQYAQAATVALFGDHWLGLRYPSVAFGLLGLAVTYVLVRRLFGVPVALLTGGWLAVSFWPIFYARVALRAISLPFTAALAAYFLFRAIESRTSPRSRRITTGSDDPFGASGEGANGEKPRSRRIVRSGGPAAGSDDPFGASGEGANGEKPRSRRIVRSGDPTAGYGDPFGANEEGANGEKPRSRRIVRSGDPTAGSGDPFGASRSRATDWLLAGVFVGLSLYTYMAARILPAILSVFLIYFYLVRSSPPPWRYLLMLLLVAALVSAPLVIWLATHPGAEFRIAEVQKPLDRLLAGDPSLVWQNFVANLKFFTIAGDPWPRQNVPGRPVFADPVSAALFYAGLLTAVWRWRDPRYGFLLIWLLGSLGPSVATSVAPSSIRDVLGLVVVFVFPALALTEVSGKLQVASGKWQVATCILLSTFYILFLAPCFLLAVRDYFTVWPRNEVVRFDYQSDLTAVAHRLDELAPGTDVVVAGLSVHSMDGPGLELAARRDVRGVRLCDTRETLLVPFGRDAWLFVPRVVPFDADLRERLLDWGATVETGPHSSFTTYRLPDDAALRRASEHLTTTATQPDGVPVTLPASFDGQMTFWGYEWLEDSESLTLLTWWRVEQAPSDPVRIFVHLIGESDTRVAQHDGLGSPVRGWSSGDWIVQKHVIPLPADLPPGLYTPQLGLYNAPTGPRLLVGDADRLLLPAVEIE